METSEGAASTSQDFVVRDGFPALLRKDGKGPLIEGEEPLPRRLFGSFGNALVVDKDDDKNESLWETLREDCAVVFSARTKEDDAAYSAGTTYFCPCQMKPRCALEALALQIFQQHTKGLEGMYRPEQSGAEWWTLVMDVVPPSTTTPDKQQEQAQPKSDNDDDDDDDDDDDEVGMHFDADYGLEAQAPDLMLHPRVATVTYLSSVGAPTLVLDRKSPHHRTDPHKQSLSGNVTTGWLSGPAVGKHICFDGRLLHGAPATFFPACKTPQQQQQQQAPLEENKQQTGKGDNDGTDEPQAKRAKVEPAAAPPPPPPPPPRRVTFLVNVWLNHCPMDADLLDDEVCASLQTPWKKKKTNDDDKPTMRVSLSTDTPDRLNQITLQRSKDDPAGSEETVICNRQVTIHYNDTMENQHAVSQQTSGGTSLELAFNNGALSIEVGDKVEDEDDEEE